jgi:hypothetical protein
MLRKLHGLSIMIGVLLLATPVLAGGWAVITVDSLPAEIRAGELLTIGFMVRQHGQTPINGVPVALHARNDTTGELISAGARQSGESGHYVVDVVFPGEGQWVWSISASPFLQEGQFAPLTVLPTDAPERGAANATSPVVAFPLREALRWAGLSLLAAAFVLALFAFGHRNGAGNAAVGG